MREQKIMASCRLNREVCIMEKNTCVLFRSDDFADDEAKKHIIDIMKYIEPKEFTRISIYNDVVPAEGYVGEGIYREFLLKFVCENLFTTRKIYVSSIIDISHDMTEVNIFVALMHLFGIEIYSTKEGDNLYPDELYLDGLRKYIKEKLDGGNVDLHNVEDEKQVCVFKIVWDIMRDMWEEYRKF